MILLYLFASGAFALCSFVYSDGLGAGNLCMQRGEGNLCLISCDTRSYVANSTAYQCVSNQWVPEDGNPIVCQMITCPEQIQAVVDDVKVTADCTGFNRPGLDCNVHCAAGYYGQTVSYNCINDLSGNGVWTGSLPTCEALTCNPTPTVTSGEAYKDEDCDNVGYGDICDVECSQGYNGDAVPYVCGLSTIDGLLTWKRNESYVHNCAKRSCSASISDGDTVMISSSTTDTIANAGASCTATEYEESCTVSCLHGFGSDSEHFECDLSHTGTGVMWKALQGVVPTCERHDCGATISGLDPSHSYSCDDTLFEDTCDVTCAAGYEGSSGETYTCGASGWSGSTPSCAAKDCGAPTLPDLANPQTNCSTLFPSECIVTCDVGYEPIPLRDATNPAKVNCVAAGSWLGDGLTLDCQEITSNSTTIINNNAEDKSTEWTLFWIFISIGIAVLLACIWGVYYIYSDPDGDKRGIGKKGLTNKQKMQILDLPEFKELRDFLHRQPTMANVFAGTADENKTFTLEIQEME